MYTLQIKQYPDIQPDLYHVEVKATRADAAPETVSIHVAPPLTSEDRESIRWYIEDYLDAPQDPAPHIAARVEQRMAAVGTDLFRSVFQESKAAQDLWATVSPHLSETRIEVITGIADATAIPWELIREPEIGPLAIKAASFVRSTGETGKVLWSPQRQDESVRVLLAICRPRGSEDVPFRSVASHLIKGLNGKAHRSFQLDVLRPPTFDQLKAVLKEASDREEPYHIVHFDGHGEFSELPGRPGKHGYLAFESPRPGQGEDLVDGRMLGDLLVESKVKILVLNACRSAFAEAPNQPSSAKTGNLRRELEAYGSLAQEVIYAGVAGVVAMQYNIYVATAAWFIDQLYSGLAQGETFGDAVSRSRKSLAEHPLRQIAYEPRPLQDWCVPVVYERVPVALSPRDANTEGTSLPLRDYDALKQSGVDDELLDLRPDIGFYGRDETLYALDRAFDTHKVVLLHAYAGSGKTATAAEFAYWYVITGGIQGRVLLNSFEHHVTLEQVLEKIGQIFGTYLKRKGIHWDALTETKARRDVALKEILADVPVLWIWDNVEPVHGFPAGSESKWSSEEQRELADFLMAASKTKVKFLLTSRRNEQEWLGDLPARVSMPPMPLRERYQLAQALAQTRGRKLPNISNWLPLLNFTQGNPLTIVAVVGQALRYNIETADQINEFVAQLRAGEVAFEVAEGEDRSKSLAASLNYGFGHAFGDEERRQIALLHLFQSSVATLVFCWMGDPRKPWCLNSVRGITREQAKGLFNRAAEIGLLSARYTDAYVIHPALPWHLKGLFDQYYPDADSAADKKDTALKAEHAFASATALLGNYLHVFREEGKSERQITGLLATEENNLLQAWTLARRRGWWPIVIQVIQAFSVLYRNTGREWTSWERLLKMAISDFVEPNTDGPLPGLEEEWSMVTGYRVELARRALHWDEAERLQGKKLEWNKRRAKAALDVDPDSWDDTQYHTVRNLAASFQTLGHILREQRKSECVGHYKESMSYLQLLDDERAESICAFNLGHAHMVIPELRDLDTAEKWYRTSLELTDIRNTKDRAMCKYQLGLIASQRLEQAMRSFASSASLRDYHEIIRHASSAENHYNEALALLPRMSLDELGTIHTQLGKLYAYTLHTNEAMKYFSKAISYRVRVDDTYGAAKTRLDAAEAFAIRGQLPEAILYARSALSGFVAIGDKAAADIQATKELIGKIEKELTAQEP